MQSTHVWALLLVAGLGILHAVSPARATATTTADDPGFRAFLRDFERGKSQVVESGAAVRVEYVSTMVSGDLAYTVTIERSAVRLDHTPATATAPTTLRVTRAFRKGDGRWKLLYRHADPIVETTAPASVLKP